MSQFCRLELTQGSRWSRLAHFQSFWGQQAILWVPLLLRAKKALADCLGRMKKLWRRRSSFAFMQACLGSLCTFHLGLGRKVNICYLPKAAQPCCAGPILAAEGTLGPQDQPVPRGLGAQAVPVSKADSKEGRGSSAWSAVLVGSCLSGAGESKLLHRLASGSDTKGWLSAFWLRVFGGALAVSECSVIPVLPPHHTPRAWIKY